ncbi:MAG: penicillin-binding protein [Clostridium sp.]|jgi:penicillin-binding protein 1A|nr:penicillin-binding protein [Clostridium sp.]
MNYGRKETKQKIKAASSRKKKYANWVFLSFFKTVLVLFLFVAVTGISMGIGMFRGILDSSPGFNPDSFAPSGYFSTIYNSAGEVTDTLVGSNANRIEASYEEFPQDLIDAFVAIEDARFWQHNGIDFRSITRAAVGVLTNNYSGGASTLTQQLIKNTVFNGGMETSKGAKLERKIQEQYLALQLTKNVDRKIILTNYLNTINLGNNTLGVKAAALRYFNKDISELTLSECAVIAGITKNPGRLNPITGPDDNAERREVILKEMYEQGYISKAQQEEALADDVYSRIQNVDLAIRGNTAPYSYYTDELIGQVTEALKEQLGYTDTQASNLLFSGGLQIFTPQDPNLQAIVDEEINNPENYDAARYSVEYRLSVAHAGGETKHYSQQTMESYIRQVKGQTSFEGLFDSEEEVTAAIEDYKGWLIHEGDTVIGESANIVLQPQTSFVLMEQSTGYVKALSGGRGEKKANRTLNRATDSVRQPGSTFKVVTSFAPAIDTCGATLATVYYDGPYTVGEKSFRNWWGADYKGYHTIREGIIYSMNIVALRCMNDTVTPQLGVEYAEKMGITTLSAADLNLATALGGLSKGVTNLDLTNSFATIANGGTYTKPVFFTKILDHNGKVLIENVPETRPALKDSTAFLLTDALSDAMQSNSLYARPGAGVNSTGTAAAIPGMSCAGKSGTTTNNVDIWFVGFTPYYTAGIWGGCDANQSLKDSAGARNGGTSFHKRIWRAIMTRVHEGLPDPGFPVPDSIETAQVCRKSGKLPISGVCTGDPRGSNAVYTEYFAKGTIPAEACDHHVRISVCAASGGKPTAFCPAEQLESKTVMSVPEDGEGGTDDTVYAAPDFCTVHNGASTIIDPSQGQGDIFGPGYIPEQTAPGNPYMPSAPSPFTTSPFSAAPGTTAPYTASYHTTAPDTAVHGSEPPTTVSAFSKPSSDESSAPSIAPTVPERWHDWKYWDNWWDW